MLWAVSAVCLYRLTTCRVVARSGRAWKAEELRLKSFEDLHTLWYVLLKESNMLLSERERTRKSNQRAHQPDRLLKVRLSMARIHTVLEERKRLHFRLKQYQREHLLSPATTTSDAATATAAATTTAAGEKN